MSQRTLEITLLFVAAMFTLFFAYSVIPALLNDGDIPGAFAAGFVNPYASGYSMDVILCWVALLIWVVHDQRVYSVRHGWLCLVLGIVPGVVVGLCLYIITRSRQLSSSRP